MSNKRIIIILALSVLTIHGVYAARYTIYKMSDQTIRIGERTLKVGDSFAHEDILSIEWKSNKQWIEVKDKETKDYRTLTRENTKRNNKRKMSPWVNIWHYITTEKSLTTRGKREKVHTWYQLLDTLRIPIPSLAKDSIYISTFENTSGGNIYKNHTPVKAYQDGRGLFLTREMIFGPHTPQKGVLTLYRYHKTRFEAKGDEIGILYIEPLYIKETKE